MPEELTRQYQNYTCADMNKYRTAVGIFQELPVCECSIKYGVLNCVKNKLIRDKKW